MLNRWCTTALIVLCWITATAQAQPKQATPAEVGEKHTYKTVGDAELPLYVFSPKGHTKDAKAPAVVFFFGGGWTKGKPSQFREQCKHLAERGMVGITVDYRVSSRYPVKIEDCIEDAKSAMRWVRANAGKLGIDPDRIASAGGSAGGHLAACTMLVDHINAKTDDQEVSAKPNAMILFNPAMGGPDPEPWQEKLAQRAKGPVKQILPTTYADTKQPPCIIFFGTKDRLLEGAAWFRDQSAKAGNDCKLVTYEGQGHGFFNFGRSNGKYYKLTLAEMDKFLVGLGWLDEKD